jgi:hypothetical protein
MINKIKCYFGFHKWKNIGGNPLDGLELGSTTHVSKLHQCEYCKKEEMKGMGTFLL